MGLVEKWVLEKAESAIVAELDHSLWAKLYLQNMCFHYTNCTI